MEHSSQVTSLSWIPSETVTGVNKVAFGSGFTHYDDPPPDEIDNLEKLCEADVFRFANRLSAQISVENGKVVSGKYTGGCLMGSTTIALGPIRSTFAAAELPTIQSPVEITDSYARFVQTTGGHTALPAPRTVRAAPYFAFEAPTVWTTLSLTINADGTSQFELIGASPFPRHWIYNQDDILSAKAGLADFKMWWTHSFGKNTPWGDNESEALMTEVETALERELSTHIMRGSEKPEFRKIRAGAELMTQGQQDDDIFLILNGVIEVICDGVKLAELGPGTIVGERAFLENSVRTSTVKAITNVKVAAIRPQFITEEKLYELRKGHRREDDQ